MENQSRLFPDPTSQMLKPDALRPTPVVWVRELAVLRTLKAGKDNEIRRIKLRPGLNILWAKPEKRVEPVRLNEPGISGHASGKTIFCRLLRFVLGEKHFSTEAVTRSIREKFDGAWVLAEVFVSGELWLVGRPTAIGARSFSVQSCTIDALLSEEPERDSFDNYTAALGRAVLGDLLNQRLPYSGHRIQWPYLLEWLARDQECRLIQLTDWRSKLSNSESPDMTTEDQNSLMRMIIGLLDENERQELELNARLIKEKEQIASRIPILKGQAEIDHKRLESAMGQSLPPLEDGLFVDSVKSKLQQEVDEIERSIKALEEDADLKKLQEELNQRSRDTISAEGRVEVIEELLKRFNADLEMRVGLNRRRVLANLRSQLKPGEGYCAVPMEEARAKGCTLAFEQPIDLASERALQSIENEVPRLQAEIDDLESTKTEAIKHLGQLQQVERRARKELYQYQTNQLSERRLRYDKRAMFLNRIALAERAREAWQEAKLLEDSHSDRETKIRESHSRQAALRAQHQRAVWAVSDLYNEIVRAVLGNSVSGSIDLSGRYLTAKVERNGDVSSGAIDTVKILAFELAALAASVMGHGSHPRFLLHDSPREADMDASIYQRFFLWVRKLEQSFPENQSCNFQHIITTTEPPPEELSTSPWVIEPILDASKPEHRLLGVDL